MPMLKVTKDNFFEQFSTFNSETPLIIITQRGETVGYYLPAHPLPRTEQLEQLLKEGQALDNLLVQSQVNEDEIVAEFRQLRRHEKR